jgi:diguanylate cyclase (GGDEF)-like protein/PAS domain S-box-containing protein
VHDPDGQLVRVVRLRNVDSEVRARLALKQSEERFRAAMRATPIGVALVDRAGQIVNANLALARMLKTTEKALLGRSVTSLTHPDDRDIDLAMWNELHGRISASVTEEKRLLGQRGEVIWVQNALAAVRQEDGEIGSFVAQFLDVTQKHEVDVTLKIMAHHDPLTDLKNRRAVLDQMHAVLSHPPRTGSHLGVLYCDLDHFKRVNDVHGHAVGDALLVEVAKRIQSSLREGDTVGRMGGDEFLVLLPQSDGEDSAVLVARKVLKAVHRPFVSGGLTLTPSMSMGAAIGEAGDDPDQVIARADQALYAAKEAGRDRVVAFSDVDD